MQQILSRSEVAAEFGAILKSVIDGTLALVTINDLSDWLHYNCLVGAHMSPNLINFHAAI